jgi:hypothetical protein
MSYQREHLVERERRRLLKEFSPRLHMSIILLATGSAGFLASFAMLQGGVSAMWLRYPLAILFSYAIFLLLLRLWLYLQSGGRLFPDSAADILDGVNGTGGSGGSVGSPFSSSGCDAGGGGAGGSWSEGNVAPISASHGRSGGGGGSSLGGFSFGLDLDDLVWLLLAAAAILGALLAVLYIIYIAPALLAEVLVDGVFISALYRRVRKLEQRHWLRTAVKKTLAPAIIIAAFFSVAGFCLHKVAPEAHSIGGVWTSITSAKDKEMQRR